MLNKILYRKSAVVFLFAALLLVRVAPAVLGYIIRGSGVFATGEYDQLLYLGGAHSILATGMNEFPFFSPLNFSFIAALLHLFNGNEFGPVAATALVGWLSVVVLYYLARELFDERAAFWAAFLYGCYPNLVFYGSVLYPETLALFFMICSFTLLVRHCKTGRILYLAGAGILWALASHTRGGVHLFSAGICLALALHCRRQGWAACLRRVFALMLSVYVSIYALGFLFAPFNPGIALNSKSGIGSVLHGANRLINCNSDYGMVRGSLLYAINEVGESWPEGSQLYSAELMQQDSVTIMTEFFNFVMQTPFLYLKRGLERLSFLWSPNQLIIKYIKFRLHYRSPLLADALCIALCLFFTGVVCAGSIGVAHARDGFRTLFVLFFVFYCALIFFTVGNAKLRLPLMPFIMIYAGYFCSLLIQRRAALSKGRAVCIGVLAGLLIGNGMYRYKDIALSPGEFHVRQVEESVKLGFSETALFLVEKNWAFQHYTDQQRKRLRTVRDTLHERGY